MASHIDNLTKALEYLKDTIGKKDMPLYWVELLLRVAASGDKGVTTKEVAEVVGMTQGIASRTVKLLPHYYNTVTEQWEGHNILHALQNDPIHRHRQRIYLTEHGKYIIDGLVRILKEK